MKNIDYSTIVKMDSPSLSGIIEFWDEYDTITIVLAYTELEKRRFPISQRLKDVESKICLYNAVSSIDKLLESYKEQINAITSESSDKSAESTRQKPIVLEYTNKYPMLKTLSGILKIMGYLIGAGTIMSILFVGSEGGKESLFLIASLLISGAFAVLMTLATAELIVVLVDIEHNTRTKK